MSKIFLTFFTCITLPATENNQNKTKQNQNQNKTKPKQQTLCKFWSKIRKWLHPNEQLMEQIVIQFPIHIDSSCNSFFIIFYFNCYKNIQKKKYVIN